jgi:hypothetical protein
LKAIPSPFDENFFALGNNQEFVRVTSLAGTQSRTKEAEVIMKRLWHQIAARLRDEQAGTRLVVPAKRWKWKRLGCRRCALSKIEWEKLLLFWEPLLLRAICLSRLCRTFVALGLTWKRAPGIRYC